MHLALAEHMHMYVVDRLASEVVAVHHDTKTFLTALFFGETLSREKDMTSERFVVIFAQVVEGRDVLLRNDEEVHGRLRRDVVEGDDLIIFIKLVRGDIPSHDLAEQTIHGVSPAWERLGSVTGAFVAGQPLHGGNA